MVVSTSLTDFVHMTSPPAYVDEWHVRPPAYDIYTNLPYEVYKEPEVNKIEDPRDYPYGQYLTKTNLLPSDEAKVNLFFGSKSAALGYINSSFTKHDLIFRNNISTIFKQMLDRRFRHNYNDTFSPYHSF